MAAHEYDPDDNFGHAFPRHLETDDDDALDVVAWQFLLLVNPDDEDEPALWRRDYTGAIEQWIELGQPDESRLRKASGRAMQVVVVGYGGQAAEAWWKRNATALARLRNLSVIELDDAEVAAAEALLGRSMRVTAMIQDGELQLMDADRSVSLRPRIRMQDGVATPD